jgi:hypothetical protein
VPTCGRERMKRKGGRAGRVAFGHPLIPRKNRGPV